MPFGTSAMNYAKDYAKSALGAVKSGYGKGSDFLGGAGMAAATGAGVGGIYGATAGRDYGQSHLGGFMTGAMGGAALGAGGYRYGGAFKRGSNFQKGSSRWRATTPRPARAGPMTRRQNFESRIGTGGQHMFRQVKRDAMAAGRFIGESLGGNAALNKIKGLGW